MTFQGGFTLHKTLQSIHVKASNWAVSCDSSSMDVSDTRLASEHTELLNSNTSSNQSPQHHLISPPQPSFSSPPPLLTVLCTHPAFSFTSKAGFTLLFSPPSQQVIFWLTRFFFCRKKRGLGRVALCLQPPSVTLQLPLIAFQPPSVTP